MQASIRRTVQRAGAAFTGALAMVAAGIAAVAPARAQAPPASEFRLPALPPAPAGVVLRSVRFEGHTVISERELQEVAAPFLNRPLRNLDIEELRVAVTRAYVERGYVTSGAVLPEPAIEDGRLTLRIVEGRMAVLEQSGLGGLSERYLAARLPGVQEPLHQGRLQERFALLLNDPLFERLNARLVPGERPGQSVLAIDVTRARPWSVALTLHNQVAPSVGARSAALELGARNLLGWGDHLQASLTSTGRSSDSAGGDIGWTLPLAAGRTLLALRASHAQSSVIEEPLAQLDIASVVRSRDVSIAHPFIDETRHRLVLGLGAARRSNSTTLAGEAFSFVPGEDSGTVRVRSTRLFGELTLRDERRVFAAQASWARGSNNVPPQTQGPALPRVPDSRFSIVQLQAQGSWALVSPALTLQARGLAQRSPDALVPLEQMAVGGRRTVRGWRENQLVRDNGWALAFELLWPAWRDVDRKMALTLVHFIDAGAAWNRDESRRRLASAGLGLQASWADLEFELFAAHRLEPRLTPSRGDLQDHGIHFMLRWRPSF